MTLTTNEVRKRLARFAKTFEDDQYEKGQAAIFLTRFYECFGIAPESATLFEKFTSRIAGGNGFIDNFIPGKLIVEMKSRGKDLNTAFDQAADYAMGLKAQERSEEHTSELKSLMRISYAVFCLKKKREKVKIY